MSYSDFLTAIAMCNIALNKELLSPFYLLVDFSQTNVSICTRNLAGIYIKKIFYRHLHNSVYSTSPNRQQCCIVQNYVIWLQQEHYLLLAMVLKTARFIWFLPYLKPRQHFKKKYIANNLNVMQYSLLSQENVLFHYSSSVFHVLKNPVGHKYLSSLNQ